MLNVENCRPLHPWSKHCGFGREFRTRGITELFCAFGDEERAAMLLFGGGGIARGGSYAGYAAGVVDEAGYMVGRDTR